jgi:ribosomal protein S18 acetylase RimI-like enzyme
MQVLVEVQRASDLIIEELTLSERHIMRFLKVSYGIYKDDDNWVAPLLMDLKKVFTSANPLFQHAEIRIWIASRKGQDVGRIAGIYDKAYCATATTPACFFGFFECENDLNTAKKLFEAVSGWALTKGIQKVMGPMNPTTNDECGLLVEGFDTPPSFMMPYNPRYYVDLFEQCGLGKAKDLLAFYIDLSTIPLDRLTRIGEKVKSRNPKLKFRPIQRKTLEEDLGQVKKIYNDAWQANWGFVPMTDSEINFMAERLKPLLMEGLIWLVEDGNDPVAFLLAMPDYNYALKPLKGRLFTPAIFGFLPYVFGWKRPPAARVLTLGVKTNYRSKGLESAMLIEGLKVGFEAGFKYAEASWILEDNTSMSRVIEAIGGKAYKRYRIYDSAPNPPPR